MGLFDVMSHPSQASTHEVFPKLHLIPITDSHDYTGTRRMIVQHIALSVISARVLQEEG